MGKSERKRKPVKKSMISHPTNFVHPVHLGPMHLGNRPHDSGVQANIYVEPSTRGSDGGYLSPQNKLPPPCPGSSSSQNDTARRDFDQVMLDRITRSVTEAVRQEVQHELQPLRDAVQRLLTHTANTPRKQTTSCPGTIERATADQISPLEASNSEYANVPESVDVAMKSASDVVGNIPNPMYSQEPEALPAVCHTKLGPRAPRPTPRTSRDGVWRQNRGRQRNMSFNERDCYAKALRTHIEDIVGSTLFAESDLPDVLIAGDCLTEDECRTIREKVDRKDQVRILVTVIKTRDLKVLKQFIDYLKKDNKTLVQKIEQSIETNERSGFRERKCSLCKLKSQINVKYVADKLWAEDCIKDDLYNELVYTEKPTGTQDKLWERILDSFAAEEYSRHAFQMLQDFLRTKGHYVHLADEIQKLLSNRCGRFECVCNIHVRMSAILLSSSSSSNTPQSTDLSSTEILSGDLSYRNSTDDQRDSTSRKSYYITVTARVDEDQDEDQVDITKYGKDDQDSSYKDLNKIGNVESTELPPPPLPMKRKPIVKETTTVVDDYHECDESYDSETTFV